MEKNEKIREHIQIAEKKGVSFPNIVTIIVDSVKEILEDELVAFAFINEQGLVVGSESVRPVESYIYDDGTLFRAYTTKGRWRISAVRRKDSGWVTLVEILAPHHDAEKVAKLSDYVIKRTKGIRIVMRHD